MTLIFWSIIFIISLIILIKSSDYFTDSAEKIGIFFKMPAFLIGVTIIAIGTSLPELISSIISVLKNASQIVIGNVIGSNIANILLVLGVAAIISKKTKITFDLMKIDIPLLIGSTILLGFSIIDLNVTILEAVLCIAGITIYFIYASTKKEKIKQSIESNKKVKETNKLEIRTIAILIISTIGIYFGAKYVVESVIQLSDILQIGKEIIALSAVAIGTSLPELVVSITAINKKKADIAIGNIIGSNIFNSLGVIGISRLFGELIIPENIITFSLPTMVIATLLYIFATQDKEITIWEGLMFITLYIFYIGKIFFIL